MSEEEREGKEKLEKENEDGREKETREGKEKKNSGWRKGEMMKRERVEERRGRKRDRK